jgi:hypothetical protein
MKKAKIQFFIKVSNGKWEEEQGDCYIRLKDEGIDVILEEDDDWERNYMVHCKEEDTGFYGDDRQGVQTSLNFINRNTLMGYWKEDGLLMPVIITVESVSKV